MENKGIVCLTDFCDWDSEKYFTVNNARLAALIGTSLLDELNIQLREYLLSSTINL